MKKLDEKNLEILQNIEFRIVEVYRADKSLLDFDVRMPWTRWSGRIDRAKAISTSSTRFFPEDLVGRPILAAAGFQPARASAARATHVNAFRPGREDSPIV